MSRKVELDAAYERLCCTLPKPLALYCLCAVADVAYTPTEVDRWSDYATAGSFDEGVTDYNTAFMAGMDEQTRWATVWGDGYSENDYKRLDELYMTMTAQLDGVGIIDRQQEDTARTCARMGLQRDKLILSTNKDDVKAAKDFDEMIRKNLADAAMRKADILPSQKQRLDGIVDALRKKYGVDGDLTMDQACEVFFKWCRQRKHPQTIDAEEHALLAIIRNIQKNDDMPEPAELPGDMRLTGFSNEFAEEPNEQEEEAYRYLHLVREKIGGEG